MVSIGVRVADDATAPESVARLLEALDVAARIGADEGLGEVVVVVGDGDLPDTDLVATTYAGVLPDPRALWRLADALADASVGTALARQLPLEWPEGEPPTSFAMARRGAGPGHAVVVPDAVVFRDERLPGEGEPEAAPEIGPAAHDAGLFLSVVMRTQGRRPQELREALLSLAAQTSSDFEVLVVPHRTSPAELVVVECIVAEQPASLRDRIRVLPLAEGGRAAPLNLGLEQGRGRYLGIVDDDDIVLAHWVETFAAAERGQPGRLLRSMVLVQEMEAAELRGRVGLRASGPLLNFYAPRFSLARHVAANQSPTLGWITPRWLVEERGLRFDDSMTTTEDWEFLLRAAEIAGVTDTEEPTSIYRRYGERESSRTLHPTEEWQANESEIERRMDAKPLLLPAGETRELRRVYARVRDLERRVADQARELRRSTRRADRLQEKVRTLRGRLRGDSDQN